MASSSLNGKPLPGLSAPSPQALGIAEVHIHQVTGYAADEHRVGVSGIDEGSNQVVVTWPADQAEVAIGALRKAQKVAETLGPAKPVAPAQVATYPESANVAPGLQQFDGVFLALDIGRPEQQLLGLQKEAAVKLGHALIKAAEAQQNSRKRLIIPTT